MGKHRFLNEWAEREQRRFEAQQAKSRPPRVQSKRQRILQGFFGSFATALKCLLLPLYVVWIVTLITQHTVQSLALAVGIVMLFSLSAFTTAYVIRARRASGVNWLTGLAPKVRSN